MTIFIRIPEKLKDVLFCFVLFLNNNQEASGQRECVEARCVTSVAFIVMTTPVRIFDLLRLF